VPARQVRPATKIGLLALGVLLVAMLFLLSPKGGRLCTTVIRIAGPFTYVFLCDSPAFMRMAHDPGRLFDATRLPNGRYVNNWQTRPLFVLTAAMIARPILWIFGFAGHPYYAAFIAMNFVIVVLAVVLFDRLFAPHDRLVWPLLAVALPLVANDVVKERFWSPHTQMLNILAPVVSMVLCRGVLTTRRSLTRHVLGSGLLAGALPLFYGIFFAVLPAMLLAVIWRTRDARALAPALALVLAFAAPTVAWALVLRWNGGVFYSVEMTEFRQFVWIVDAATAGSAMLAARVRTSVTPLLASLGPALWFPVTLLLLVAAWTVAHRLSLRETLRAERATVVAATVTFASFAAFLWALGTYVPRLSFALVPPVLAVTAVLVTEAVRRTSIPSARRLVTSVGLSSVAYLVFEIATHGV